MEIDFLSYIAGILTSIVLGWLYKKLFIVVDAKPSIILDHDARNDKQEAYDGFYRNRRTREEILKYATPSILIQERIPHQVEAPELKGKIIDFKLASQRLHGRRSSKDVS